MKTFKKVDTIEIQAVQFGSEETQEFVQLCTKDHKGNIRPVPRDLMGTPKDAFHAVKTMDGWQTINVGDWIVKKNTEVLVISNGVFKLLFIES